MQAIAEAVKAEIESRYGRLVKLGNGNSLFAIPSTDMVVYFRYSKIFQNPTKAFYGLRKQDVDLARGKDFYLCFVTDEPGTVFTVPFADFEACYDYAGAGADGQYKTIIYFRANGPQLYVSKGARFSAEAYRGLGSIMNKRSLTPTPELDHSGAQTLVGAIGAMKGHRVWFPKSDVEKIDPGTMDFSKLCRQLPIYNSALDAIFQEIDVIWLADNKPAALFEVEHSTPIYSGLLRINDVLISSAYPIDAKIVAAQKRRDIFQRQIRRPTFSAHKLEENVSFISYDNLWHWHNTLKGGIHHGRSA